MPESFGDQLKLFALSIDVVDRDRFDDVNGMIDQYCREVLHITSTKLWLKCVIEGVPGLRRYSLGNDSPETFRRIKDSNGKYMGQIALAFDRAKPLWVVSAKGQQNLSNSESYRDRWSRLRSIPAYRKIDVGGDHETVNTKTSIIVPIRANGDVLGGINFETKEYLEITDGAKLELKKIAETVGILERLRRGNERQRGNTEAALDKLRTVLNRPHPKLTKPKMFLASSAGARKDVVDAIMETLAKYKHQIDLEYWKSLENPGNITTQLLRVIDSCQFGICYFSEKTDLGEHPYRDNPNVLFEAGMFHGRRDDLSSKPSSWIPVREKDSPLPPFDFAQERILKVKRNKNGDLMKRQFTSDLRGIIEKLIEAD